MHVARQRRGAHNENGSPCRCDDGEKGGSKSTPIEFNSQPTKRFPLRVHICSHPHFTLSHLIVEISRCACALEAELRVEEFQEIFQIYSIFFCGWMSSHETRDKSRFQYESHESALGEIQYLFTVDKFFFVNVSICFRSSFFCVY